MESFGWGRSENLRGRSDCLGTADMFTFLRSVGMSTLTVGLTCNSVSFLCYQFCILVEISFL